MQYTTTRKSLQRQRDNDGRRRKFSSLSLKTASIRSLSGLLLLSWPSEASKSYKALFPLALPSGPSSLRPRSVAFTATAAVMYAAQAAASGK